MSKFQTNFTGDDHVGTAKLDDKPAVDETDFEKLAEDTVSDEKNVAKLEKAARKDAADLAEKVNAENAAAIEEQAKRTKKESTPSDPKV